MLGPPSSMWLLGISPSHEASAALLHDGVVVRVWAEERRTRFKWAGGRLRRLAMEGVLQTAGVARRDIDCIAVVADRFPEDCIRHPHGRRELARRLRSWRDRLRGLPVRDVAMGHVQRALQRMGREPNVEPYVRTARFLARERFRPDARLRFFDHHASHAMAGAYCSGFDEAAVVTVDRVGHLGVHHPPGGSPATARRRWARWAPPAT